MASRGAERKVNAAAPKSGAAKPKQSTAKPKPGAAKPKQSAAKPKQRALATFAALRAAHPDAHCELNHTSAFELIVATVLSAQSTDVSVNKATPALFARWPTPQALAQAEPADVEAVLSKIGMFRQKTKNIIGLAKKLCTDHGAEVPRSLAQLIELPGVGRKTANVVLGVAFGAPEGVVVDTHVQRITQRLAWTEQDTPEKIERDLMQLFPQTDWDALSHTLIFHGRRICTAIKPACAACPVNTSCPSAFHAEHIGRKPARSREKASAKVLAAKPASKALKAPSKKTAKKPSRTSSS
jgi:endonuclease III